MQTASQRKSQDAMVSIRAVMSDLTFVGSSRTLRSGNRIFTRLTPFILAIMLMCSPVFAQSLTTSKNRCDDYQRRFSRSVLCDDPAFPQCTLIVAIRQRDNDLLKCFLDLGISPNVESGKYAGPEIPLIDASWEGDIETLKLILNKNADTEITEKQFGMTAILWILRFKPKNREAAFAVRQLLIERGANTNARDFNGITPLMLCSENNDLTCVQRLLSAGAEPELRSEKGATALMLAADNEELLATLIKDQKDIDQIDNRGRTALFYSIEKGQLVKSRILLMRGAAPDHVDFEGLTPRQLAERLKDSKIKTHILELIDRFDGKKRARKS